MPSDLPKYVKRIPRGDRVHLYFRFRGAYTKLPPDPASAEFFAAYAQALEGTEKPSARERCAEGSVNALIRDFKASPEFATLAAKTQRDYARALDHLGLALGRFPAKSIKRPAIIKLRNKIATRGTRAADFWVSVVARCFRIGVDLGYVEVNPAEKIERINDAEEFKRWPAEARAAFETSSPPPHVMTAYMIGLWTAQSLGDVLHLARPIYDGRGFNVRRRKTERSGYIPAFSLLKAYLDKLPKSGVLFVTKADGARWTERAFSEEFRAWLDGLGLHDLHFHGLRKTTSAALAEAGASPHEIASITLHATIEMVEHYTKEADQRRMAHSAIAKLEVAHRKGSRGKRR
ncbi:MAG: tyrosine-type recombinase/integrase [Hyphomicrobium sp.]|uniref:tyrosine-type recombinase/integrase n=1 Tax=Hyphomicrobium sp. TaxID=82 RepID=UPI003D140ABC